MTAVMTPKHSRTSLVDGEASFSMEPTTQTSPTPIAFNAVDTGVENILDVHTADDDGSWSNEDEHRSDRNTRLKNGTYCGTLCGHVVRDSPKQKLQDVVTYDGIQGHSRAAQSSIRGNITILLSQERPDHDLVERTSQFCCERRIV